MSYMIMGLDIVYKVDGDALNILYLFNKDVIEASKIISPKEFFIDRNDGSCNADVLPARDTIINANALKYLHYYTPEELNRIKWLQQQSI